MVVLCDHLMQVVRGGLRGQGITTQNIGGGFRGGFRGKDTTQNSVGGRETTQNACRGTWTNQNTGFGGTSQHAVYIYAGESQT